ncbi:MAG: quinol:cytochrome C oxidoreductase [Mariniblastus sp.]|nr:quinol:cytochrome C oxidoreductase [Mariniblastus sp.]
MHEARIAKITSPIVSLKDNYVRLIPISLIVAAAGIGSALLLSLDMQRFSYAYLTSFCTLMSICLGGLFFVIIMNLTRAGWSVTLRRIAEIIAMCTLPMFFLYLPILVPVLTGSDAVYVWNAEGWSIHGTEAEKQAALAEADYPPPIEALKALYLNRYFFGIRMVAYFLAWGGMAWFFLSNSLKQDKTGDKSLSVKMQKNSTWMLILFAATLVFASFDFEMSLAPFWFSTMWPVYFFSGSMLSALATITLICLLLQRTGRVTDEITVEHYHDMGKLMFAFVVFWGYIAFSQFLLIWYANIPEETFWYAWRINPASDGSTTGWQWVSLLLLFGHLLIPLLALMARTVRRSKNFLFFATIYLLIMHWVDHFWIVMPQYTEITTAHTGPAAGLALSFNPLVDIPCVIGMAGVFVALFCLIARDRPLVPLKDPRLGEALAHHNP